MAVGRLSVFMGDTRTTEFERDVFSAELDEINQRRAEVRKRTPVEGDAGCLHPAQIEPVGGPSTKHGLVGLALSGGGIRSAAFSLGVLQALNASGIFAYVDYLSTVSGGGWIGSGNDRPSPVSGMPRLVSGVSTEASKAWV